MTEQVAAKDNLLLDVRHLKKYFPIRRGFLRRTVGMCARWMM